VRVCDEIDNEFYKLYTKHVSSSVRFDCNTYMTTHAFTSNKQLPHGLLAQYPQVEQFVGKYAQRYSFVYSIRKTPQYARDQLRWSKVRRWYCRHWDRKQNLPKQTCQSIREMVQLIERVNAWKDQPSSDTQTQGFRHTANWEEAMRLVLQLTPEEIRTMQRADPARYGLNKMSAAMWLENDAYCAQGTFKHIVLRVMYPDLPLTADDVMESMYDNLGFMYQIRALYPEICFSWRSKMVKMCKYIRRIYDAAMQPCVELGVPTTNLLLRINQVSTEVDEIRKKGEDKFQNGSPGCDALQRLTALCAEGSSSPSLDVLDTEEQCRQACRAILHHTEIQVKSIYLVHHSKGSAP